MNISCIAIDDEPLALEIIEEYIEKVPFLNLLKTFNSGLESLEFLKKEEVDLIFLDIQMDDLTGFQFLRVLNNPPSIIFTTAFENYALDGFEWGAIDYLLKPISFERFVRACDKVTQRLYPNQSVEVTIPNHREDYIFIKTGYSLQKVCFKDILYIEGQRDYLKIVTSDEGVMTLQSFKDISTLLPADTFVRTHKSYMVSMDHIDKIENNRILIGDTRIPISETYSSLFYSHLKNRKLML